MTGTMKAVVLTRFGGSEAFEEQDVPVPQVGARQVRVRVHATAINPLDIQVRRGDYTDVPLPTITGHDVSGVVEELGSAVSEFSVGDEVYYTPRIFGGPGSYAEQHVADVELVGRKPSNLTHLEAASLTLVGGTVWQSFVTRAHLTVGETVLIHGGAGGIGTIAIQVAKAIGARVITTARRSNHTFVHALGADHAIDYTTADYVPEVNALTGGRGVDVVVDTVGGDTLTRSPLALAPLGRVVSIVDIARPQNLIEAWGVNAAYHFVFTRQNRGKLDALTDLVERGLVRPVIGAVIPWPASPRRTTCCRPAPHKGSAARSPSTSPAAPPTRRKRYSRALRSARSCPFVSAPVQDPRSRPPSTGCRSTSPTPTGTGVTTSPQP